MSEYVKLAGGAGDQYLATLGEMQENFLKSVTSLSAWVPPAPPVSTVPFTVDLPTPREIVETNFSFTEKLLKQQRAFTEKFLAAMNPTTSTAAVS